MAVFRPNVYRQIIHAVCFLALAAVTVADAAEYRLPPPAVVDILEAPPTPAVSLSPDRQWMVLVERAAMPPIEDLAQPMTPLAGLQVNPRTNGPHSPRSYVGLSLGRLADANPQPLDLPDDAHVGWPNWSPDSRRFAFTITQADGIELWVADVEKGQTRRIVGPQLNAAAGSPFSWMPDSRTLIVRLVPHERGEEPQQPTIPTGPVVRESSGTVAPVRTYQNLLRNTHDETLFDHFLTSQLAVIDVRTGQRTDIGEPAVYTGHDASPNGQYVLVSRVVRPYSYLVPLSRFARVLEVWTPEGQVVAEVARLPLQEAIPIQGVATGPRRMSWRDTADATLVWAEALDEGDPRIEVPHRDKIMALEAPFTGTSCELLRVEHRFSGLSWLESDVGEALVSEYDRDRRWRRTWLYAVDQPDREPRLVWDRSIQDRYNDPGSPLTVTTAAGRSVVRVEDGAILLGGTGSTPAGDRPFLDRMELETFETERLWRCQPETYEYLIDLLPGDTLQVLTRFETPQDPPNYFLRDLEGGQSQQITHFEDPAPQLRGVHRELVTYERDDGTTLSANLFLPSDYEPGTRLPLIVWAYPREFNDPETAGQISGSPYRFSRPSGTSIQFLLLEGYALMAGATMPVIGDPETANDTFVEQIVSSAQAAIDKADAMGVADRRRVAIAGHSYGGFMAANLLAHSDLFRAGIARSGAYNRSLTPFGFQGERRTLWEAGETYSNLSPFFHAHQINQPLLLIHGQMDSNSGTYPMQSERLYHAIKGHGGTARLVMLPYEEHGYRAHESVMHVLAETIDWLNTHVRDAELNPAEEEDT